MSIEKKLEDYRVLKQKLADVKQEEMDLRVEICETIGKGLSVGTHNFSEYDGIKVKLVNKLNYKIDKTILETLVLSDEELECVRWKPDLNLTKYKELSDDIDDLNEAIIITNAAPALTVELTS